MGTPVQKTNADEDLRIEMLLDAQNTAAELFAEIGRSGVVRAGVGEKQLSDEIRDMRPRCSGLIGTGTSGSCGRARPKCT